MISKKITFFIIFSLGLLIINCISAFAYPNLFSIHINSIEPKIECIEVKYNDSIINHCEENIYKYNDDGTLNDLIIKSTTSNIPPYYSYYPVGEYNKIRDFFNHVCSTKTEHTLPNGTNWCDKKQVDEYFNNKENDFLILSFFKDKYKLATQNFIVNYEMRYYRPPESESWKLVYIIISIILAGAVITWGIVSQFKPRKKTRNSKI